MSCKKLYLLPVFLFLFLPASVLITLAISIIYDHVSPVFPYISDTGAFPPESCIFGLLLNFAAYTMLGSIYMRYLQVEYYVTAKPGKGVGHNFNKVTAIIGAVSCLGLDIVANFQVISLIDVHMTGAMLCFGTGIVYFALQVWISYKIPGVTSKHVLLVRTVFVILCCTATIITIGAGIAAYRIYPGTYEDARHWKREEPGWELHLVSTISEWIMCMLYSFLMLSFVPDLWGYELVLPKVMPKDNKC
ncbi:DNA damage-regulated autophagy modulator protein 2-like [Periplaneta americana]|uniref:DNA damage-regulated autophagy modulator protein 2-like n=1 Tax=Periplaneta americana TaxID=6978 RepID=UPI0037E9BB1F